MSEDCIEAASGDSTDSLCRKRQVKKDDNTPRDRMKHRTTDESLVAGFLMGSGSQRSSDGMTSECSWTSLENC